MSAHIPEADPIVSAVYDPIARRVTLTPRFRLAPNGEYLLTVSGAGALPVRDVYGTAITGTGTGGLPGDFIAGLNASMARPIAAC